MLQFWEDTDAFHQQLALSEGKPEFTFYDGPPFATGLPHYGHIAAGTIKVSGVNPGGQAIQRVMVNYDFSLGRRDQVRDNERTLRQEKIRLGLPRSPD